MHYILLLIYAVLGMALDYLLIPLKNISDGVSILITIILLIINTTLVIGIYDGFHDLHEKHVQKQIRKQLML